MSIKTIIDAVRGEKIGEAEKQLADYVAEAQISPEDRGALYADAASVYLRTNSEMMQQYKDFLEETSTALRDLNLKEKILTPEQ